MTLSGGKSEIKEENIFEFSVSKETVGTYHCRSNVSDESIKVIMDGHPGIILNYLMKNNYNFTEYSEPSPRTLEVKTASASKIATGVLLIVMILLL